ncbi:MAG: phage tail protein [Anaerolineae bacterium]|nr:phage tail protein [Anaerolineae bacterium]
MTEGSKDNLIQPFTTFNFEVVLTPTDTGSGLNAPICEAAFQECTGLDITMEPKTFPQGGMNDRQTHRIGQVTYGRLTLKRGMTGNLQLWDWLTKAIVPGNNLSALAEIRMWSSANVPTLTFFLEGCLPVKFTAPALNAQTGGVAIEELQLVYEYLSLKPAEGSTSSAPTTTPPPNNKVSGGPGLENRSGGQR